LAENEKEVNVKVSSPPQAAKLEAIEELIRGFNESTAKLQGAYASLQEKFERINVELEESNRELSASLAEKDKLSRYLTDILESLTSGVLVLNLSGKITLMNKRAEYIIDRNPLEVIGEDYFDIMGFETPVELTPIETLKTRKAIEGEKTIRNASGRNIPVSFATSLVTDHEGDIIGVVESFRDISEVKRLEQEVSRMDTLAALGQMAATVAHEIRNPLGGIAGFANLLERDLEPDDNRRRLVKKIIEGVDGLNKIVTGLLSYTRKVNLVKHETDFVAFMNEIINYFEIDVNVEEEHIRIIKNYKVDTLPCSIDTELFQQIVLNLLYNAVQAFPDEKGTIEVVVADSITGIRTDLSASLYRKLLRPLKKSSKVISSGRPFIHLSILDDGEGMPEESLNKLFTPFFTTKEFGTGLGLATSRKIAESHGGEIFVESKPGKGTAFMLLVPAL